MTKTSTRNTRRLAWVLTLAATTLVIAETSRVRAAPANSNSVLMPAGVSVARPRALTTSAEYDADLVLQDVSLEVGQYCATMTDPVPDLDGLVAHLDALYDHVWAVTGPTWKYKSVIGPNGTPVKVCYLEKTILVQEDGDPQPVEVDFTETMIL